MRILVIAMTLMMPIFGMAQEPEDTPVVLKGLDGEGINRAEFEGYLNKILDTIKATAVPQEHKVISAYDIWLHEGNKGSEKDFIKSLRGAQGPQGPQGLAGEKGPQGVKGDEGKIGGTGPQGPQGLAGDQGPQGVKGDEGKIGGTGPQGPQGLAGEKGPQGVKGDTGDSGSSEAVTLDMLSDLGLVFTKSPANDRPIILLKEAVVIGEEMSNSCKYGSNSLTVGPSSNCASGKEAVVIGGASNIAEVGWGAVIGGKNNLSGGNHSLVAGGQNNSAPGITSLVAGGQSSTTSGSRSVIVGGSGNKTWSTLSLIAGSTNSVMQAAGSNNMIAGGEYIKITGSSASYAAVLGGRNLTMTGRHSVAVGAQGTPDSNYTMADSYSLALGGFANVTNGAFHMIVGGSKRTLDNVEGRSEDFTKDIGPDIINEKDFYNVFFDL